VRAGLARGKNDPSVVNYGSGTEHPKESFACGLDPLGGFMLARGGYILIRVLPKARTNRNLGEFKEIDVI